MNYPNIRDSEANWGSFTGRGMVHAEVNEGTRATPQTHSRHGWRCCPQPSSPPAAREAVCGKACSFLLHPKASIEVMAGLLLPPNEPKLSSFKSSDIRPHSLSPPPNLVVTATCFAQAGGVSGKARLTLHLCYWWYLLESLLLPWLYDFRFMQKFPTVS